MFIFDYFRWHYLAAPKSILRIWGNYLRFFVVYFIPVTKLLKTLLSPWKRDMTSYGRGFDPKIFLESLTLNIFTRLIGAIIRIFTIFVALALGIFALLVGLLFLIFWIFWPFVLAGTLASGIYFMAAGPANVAVATLIAVFIDLASIVFFFLFYKMSRQKYPEQMNLKEIFSKDWAVLIWEKLGIEPTQVPENVIDEPEQFLDGFLNQIQIKKEDFSYVIQWIVMEQAYQMRRKEFWESENLFASGGIGRNWIYGWTTTLDRYSSELGELRNLAHLIGRREEIETIGRVLCKNQQSNVLLVGEPGVGRMTLVKQFARLVRQGRTATPLAWRRVIELDLNSALSGLNEEGQIREKLIKIFNEAASADNIILVVNDFHNFVWGNRDISQILNPYLEGSHFQLIALTTYQDLHAKIEKNPGLLKFFEKVEIKEPDFEHTLLILQDNLAPIEKRTNKRVTYQALKEIVKTADQYIADVPMPEKAIDLLEETAIYAASNSAERFVLPKHVDMVISQKTEIPIGELAQEEKQKLLQLEALLHKRVIGQDAAIQEISSAMRRARLAVASQSRPMGSFLFLGPTGVGKTETAKALAEAYFGEEKRMLRFDMSEYQGASALERMIGSAQTQAQGILTTAARENPFSLLLLDEIEKADKEILNLFLQVLDEGWLTDAFGRKINFRNMIIIATSNAGSELIRQMVGQNEPQDAMKQKILDHIQQNNIFRPEFLNRFDGIVIFTPLNQEQILQVAQIQLGALSKRLAAQEFILNLTPELAQKVSQLGFDPVFGARAMKRVIQDKIEDLIAKKMLKGEIQKNVPFEIKEEEII